MIDIVHNTINQGQIEPIKRWEVWWKGPTGVHRDRIVVCNSAKELGFEQPSLFVKAVPVAIGDTLTEVFDR